MSFDHFSHFSHFFLVFLLALIPACKSIDSDSSGLSEVGGLVSLPGGRQVRLVYLKHIMRGNDDTVGTNRESQHETALLEFAVYDEGGELWLDYTFFSPTFPSVRTQVEVGIRSNFAIRQIDNKPLVNVIIAQQSRQQAQARQLRRQFSPYFYPQLLRSSILTTNTRVFNQSRRGFKLNTDQRNGLLDMRRLGLVDTFKETSRGPVFLAHLTNDLTFQKDFTKSSKLTAISVPQRYTTADGTTAFKYQIAGGFGQRTMDYYHKSYTARIKLADSGYRNQRRLSGEFVAQAGSVFNASSLWLKAFATQASYQAIDETLLRQLKSNQLMRQWVKWAYVGGQFSLNAEMLSMADQGRANPSDDALGQRNTAGVFSTNLNERSRLSDQFYAPINATQIQNLNQTNAQYEQMLGRDIDAYNSQLQ